MVTWFCILLGIALLEFSLLCVTVSWLRVLWKDNQELSAEIKPIEFDGWEE